MNNYVAVNFLARHAGAKLQIGDRRTYSLWDELRVAWGAKRYVKRKRIERRAVTNDERMRVYYIRLGRRIERELREFAETASPIALEALASHYVARLISGHLERMRCGAALRSRWAQIGESNTSTNGAVCHRDIHSRQTRMATRKPAS